ncbi:MAG: arsenosugar biosynthesis radical SAM protein ArsS [bacterium]|nr:MAG: arsenosugar biosynthesis radical SAM protein ArsS [bacterium]
MNRFERRISGDGPRGLYALGVRTLQVNVGLRCNQACEHCHLNASPENNQVMEWPIMEKVLDITGRVRPRMVDITGGAPEMNPHLKDLISALTSLQVRVQVRTNLTALVEPQSNGLAGFFRDAGVVLAGSLPCYLEENVSAQRGAEVFGRSIEALRMLNGLGYGRGGGLILNLVYNPGGAFLPSPQSRLEEDYRKHLGQRFGIVFDRLLTLSNVPVGRFGASLKETGRLGKYLDLLEESFNARTVPGLMCRTQVSIGWDGALYDCDFNLALGKVVDHGAPDHIDRWDLPSVAARRIVTGSHCFACTAGAGSSCGGALVDHQA